MFTASLHDITPGAEHAEPRSFFRRVLSRCFSFPSSNADPTQQQRPQRRRSSMPQVLDLPCSADLHQLAAPSTTEQAGSSSLPPPLLLQLASPGRPRSDPQLYPAASSFRPQHSARPAGHATHSARLLPHQKLSGKLQGDSQGPALEHQRSYIVEFEEQHSSDGQHARSRYMPAAAFRSNSKAALLTAGSPAPPAATKATLTPNHAPQCSPPPPPSSRTQPRTPAPLPTAASTATPHQAPGFPPPMPSQRLCNQLQQATSAVSARGVGPSTLTSHPTAHRPALSQPAKTSPIGDWDWSASTGSSGYTQCSDGGRGGGGPAAPLHVAVKLHVQGATGPPNAGSCAAGPSVKCPVVPAPPGLPARVTNGDGAVGAAAGTVLGDAAGSGESANYTGDLSLGLQQREASVPSPHPTRRLSLELPMLLVQAFRPCGRALVASLSSRRAAPASSQRPLPRCRSYSSKQQHPWQVFGSSAGWGSVGGSGTGTHSSGPSHCQQPTSAGAPPYTPFRTLSTGGRNVQPSSEVSSNCVAVSALIRLDEEEARSGRSAGSSCQPPYGGFLHESTEELARR